MCSRPPYLNNNTKGVYLCVRTSDKGKRKNENKPKAIFNKFFFSEKEKKTVWLVFTGTVYVEEGGQAFIDTVWEGYCHFLRKEDGSKLRVPRLQFTLTLLKHFYKTSLLVGIK